MQSGVLKSETSANSLSMQKHQSQMFPDHSCLCACYEGSHCLILSAAFFIMHLDQLVMRPVWTFHSFHLAHQISTLVILHVWSPKSLM